FVISSSSTVTYTFVYTDSEPGRVFWVADEELSDGGSPRVIVYGYNGIPMQPVAPPSPNYVPRPEHPPSLDYVPGPEHPPSPVEVPYVPEPEYPEYLVTSDAEAPLEDQPLPANASPTTLSPGYVVDSEEEEHLALADSFAIPVFDPVPSARETEAFETDEAAPTPIPSPPLPPLPSSLYLPPPVHTSLPLPSSPLPPLPASLSVPPPVDRREDTPEAELPPRKRLCLTTPTSRNEVGESSIAAPRPTRDPTEAVEEVAPTTLEGVNAKVTELAVDSQFHHETARLLDQEALGQLSAALGHIQALQARDQTHADDPGGVGSSA
ncbi:hypothetical protein Tco_1040538, partial [Tanacetum coccineum]